MDFKQLVHPSVILSAQIVAIKDNNNITRTMTITNLRGQYVKVDTRRKFTTSANYGQIIYGWKDFPLINTNNVLRSHINRLEIRKM